MPHICQAFLLGDQEDPLGAHSLAEQSNIHSLCAKSRDLWHGAQWVLRAESAGGHHVLYDCCFLPPAPSRAKRYYPTHPKASNLFLWMANALSWCCFWVSDTRPTCSSFPPHFTLSNLSHGPLFSPYQSFSDLFLKRSLNSRALEILLLSCYRE